jgi:hypothetical protein
MIFEKDDVSSDIEQEGINALNDLQGSWCDAAYAPYSLYILHASESQAVLTVNCAIANTSVRSHRK